MRRYRGFQHIHHSVVLGQPLSVQVASPTRGIHGMNILSAGLTSSKTPRPVERALPAFISSTRASLQAMVPASLEDTHYPSCTSAEESVEGHDIKIAMGICKRPSRSAALAGHTDRDRKREREMKLSIQSPSPFGHVCIPWFPITGSSTIYSIVNHPPIVRWEIGEMKCRKKGTSQQRKRR